MAVFPSCANCGTALSGPFCSNCGQKSSDLNRPIWWILGEFLDAVFSYDSRTFRTIWLLFAEPGEFTSRYIQGKRASLLPPFRLFVIATLAFFLTLQITDLAIVSFKVRPMTAADLPTVVPTGNPAVDRAVGSKIKPRAVVGNKSNTIVEMEFFVPAGSIQHVKLSDDQRRKMLGDTIKIDKEDANADEQDWLRWIEGRSKRVIQGYERALEDPMRLNGPLNIWLPRLMLVLVPVFGLLLAVLHWWPRVFLMEHLVFSVHIHTVFFVALSLSAFAAALIGNADFLWAVWLILAVYLWMAMYRVYRRSWWLTSIKFTGLMAVYSVVLSAGLGTIFILALSEL